MELLFASYSTKDGPAFYLQTVKGIRWEIIPNELYTVKISLAAEYSFWEKKNHQHAEVKCILIE